MFALFSIHTTTVNPIALKKVKIVYDFGLFECNRVKPVRNTGASNKGFERKDIL